VDNKDKEDRLSVNVEIRQTALGLHCEVRTQLNHN